MIAALAAPAAARVVNDARLAAGAAVASVAIGAAISGSAAALIHFAGWTHGPTFAAAVTPLAEVTGAIVIGGVAGAIIAVIPSRVRAASQDVPEAAETSRRSSSTDH